MKIPYSNNRSVCDTENYANQFIDENLISSDKVAGQFYKLIEN